MSFDSLQWEESDKLQKELDALIGEVDTPVSDIEQEIQNLVNDPEMNVVDEIIDEYTWIPPQQNTSNVTKPEPITLKQEDIDMFETYENQLRNLDIRKEDALFDSLQRGELTQEQLDTFGNTPALQSEDLSKWYLNTQIQVGLSALLCGQNRNRLKELAQNMTLDGKCLTTLRMN